MIALTRPVPLEREVQRRIVTLCRTLGCTVYSLSQGYRPGGPRHGTTRQSKGLADLYVLPPRDVLGFDRCRAFWIETKRPGGKPSAEQIEFQRLNRDAGITVVVGGLDEVVAHLKTLGFRILT